MSKKIYIQPLVVGVVLAIAFCLGFCTLVHSAETVATSIRVTNSSTSASSSLGLTNNSGTFKFTIGYGNSAVSGARASNSFLEYVGANFRIISATNTKYWSFGTDNSNGMTHNELLLSVPTGQADNVLSLRNDDSAAGKISGLTFRDSSNVEKMAIGRGNGSGTYPFSGVGFIETSEIFNVSGPTVAPPFSIIQTSRNGSNTIVYHERVKFTDQGNIVFYKNDAVWPSQTAFLTLDSSANTLTANGHLHVTANVAADAMEVQQLNTSGYATTGYEDQTGTNKLVQGYGLSGVAAPYQNSAYYVSVGSSGTAVPMKFIQYNGTDDKVVMQFDSSRKVTVGVNGNAFSQVRSGTTAAMTLGAITVTDTTVTANSRIFVQRHTDGGTIGTTYSITRSAGASFTVTALGVAGIAVTTDTSTMDWMIIEP